MSRLKTSYGVVVIIGILLVSSSQFTYAESVTSSPSLWQRIVSFFDFSSTPAATIASPTFLTKQATTTVAKPTTPTTATLQPSTPQNPVGTTSYLTRSEVQTLIDRAVSSALTKFKQTLSIQQGNTPYQSTTQPLDSPSYQSIAAVGQTISSGGSGLSDLRADIATGRISISDANITSGTAALSSLTTTGSASFDTITTTGNVAIGTTSPYSWARMTVAATDGANFSSNEPQLVVSHSYDGGWPYTGIQIDHHSNNPAANQGGSYLQFSNNGVAEAQLEFDSNLGTPNAFNIFNNTANGPIIFGTGVNTERVRITSTGNVGIGTTTPWGQLSINPNGITGPSFVIGSSTNTQFMVTNGGDVNIGLTNSTYNTYGGHALAVAGAVVVDAGGQNSWGGTNGASNGGTILGIFFGAPSIDNTGEAIYSKRTSGGNSGGLDFTTGYASRLSITSGGMVGIGTTSPYAKLSVLNSADSNIGLSISGTTGQTGDLVQFYKGTDQRALIDSGGSFRTKGRYQLLESDGTTLIQGMYNDSNNLVIRAGPTVNRTAMKASDISNIAVFDGTTHGVSIGSSFTTSFTADGLLVQGNVGIGTTSPGQKLSVAGDVLGNTFIGSSFTATSSTATSTFAGGLAVGTSKFVVDSATGNVGIGTTAPTQKFQINDPSYNYQSFMVTSGGDVGIGSIYSGARLTLQTYYGTLNSQQFLFNSSGPGEDANINFREIANGGTDIAKIGVRSGTANYNGILTFSTSNLAVLAERMRIDNSGNVGIGTTTPWGKLAVTQTGTDGAPAFIVEDSASPDSTPFVVTQDGSLGIGTAVPEAKLEVVGGLKGENISLVGTPSTSIGTAELGDSSTGINAGLGGQLIFKGNTSGQVGQHRGIFGGIYGIKENSNYLDNKGALTFLTNPVISGDNSGRTTADLVERMRITSAGNIGIGTTSPYTSLAVAGATGVLANIFTATSTTATSTFAGGATFATGGGNVGIGTLIPGAKLDVTSSDGGNIRLTNNSSSMANKTVGSLDFFSADSTYNSVRSRIQTYDSGGYGGSGGDSHLGFYVSGANTSTLTQRLMLDQTGAQFNSTSGTFKYLDNGGWGSVQLNLAGRGLWFGREGADYGGIQSASDPSNPSTFAEILNLNPYGGNVMIGARSGTITSPGSKLSVNGNLSIGATYFGTAATTNGLIVEGSVGIGSTSPYALLTVSNSRTTTANTPLFTLASTTDGTATTTAFTVLASGNVGIGTTTPTSRLHVAGAIQTEDVGWTLSKQFSTVLGGITSMTVYNGRLYAGYTGSAVGDAAVMVYDGSMWATSTTLVSFGAVRSLAVYNGKLYAGTGGWDCCSAATQGDVYVFDGTTWSLANDFGAQYDSVFSLTEYNGNLYAGLGRGTNNGDVYVYNGSSWSLSKDFGASIDAIKALATYNGKLYAGLSESAGDGDIWVYDGSNWTISEDNDSTLKKVGSMTVYNGKLYAGIGGDGSTKNSEIHVFDGNTWSIASNFQANTFENIAVTGVNSMAVYNNRLYMGTGDLNGQGDVYVFDGYNWSKSRNETSSQRNPALTVYNGKLYSGSESSNPNEAKIWVYYEREESQLANNNFKNIGAWQEQYQNLTKNLTVMGNVGIGTTSPYTSLAVAGASGVLANIFTATSTTATSTFTGGATFATGGGNVGIGRTVPLVTLDVNGTTFINATNDGSTGAKLVVGGSGTTIYTPGTIWAATNYIGSNDTSLNRALVGGGSVLTTSVPIQLVNSGPILSFYSANTIKVLQGDNLTIGNLMAGTIYGGTTTNAILTLAGTANGSPSGANIVLNGTGQGSVGIGTTSPYAKLSVVGTVVATDYHATSSTLGYQADNLLGGITTLSTDVNGNIIRTPSDISLKENVVPLTNSLDRLLKLQGVSYDWKDKERFGNTKEIGFVAQQVESIVPEVVKGGSYKSLNYGNMVALVVEAVKELNTKVDAISTRLDSIQESLKNMVFDRFTAKIAYIDQIDVKKLNAVDASFSGVVTNDADVLFNKGTHFSSDVCVDNVCVTKDQFKAMLLQGGATTYGSAADQMKGINPLTANLIQATTPTEGVPTTTPTIATTTTPIETATSTTEAIVTPIPVESTPAPVASTSTPAVTETPVIVPEPVVTPVSPSPTDAATSTAN